MDILYIITAGLVGIILGYIWKHLQDNKWLRAKDGRIASLEESLRISRNTRERQMADITRMQSIINKLQLERWQEEIKFGDDHQVPDIFDIDVREAEYAASLYMDSNWQEIDFGGKNI